MKLLRQLLRRSYSRQVIGCFLMYMLLFNIYLPAAWSGPEGAQVVNGDVSIQQSAYNTTITASDKAIINYSSFDIMRPETVQFIQPSSSASVLNRILSANPTNINGTLLANGRVFFVNPAGVYIGDGARINVNQLVASALNISDSDFINGRYNFAGGNGAVINSGDISAEQVYLIGKRVTNSGTISCPAGYVVMAAGDRVFLGEPGSDIVLEIDASSLPESAEAGGSGTGVLNEGTVKASGGIIALAAAGDIYSQAISNVGSLSTSAEAGDAGQISLAAAGGEVTNTGAIEATGAEGGQIVMEGARVGQFGTVHTDGTIGDGGDVRLTASDVVALSSDSLTTANAGTNGKGGDVVVYSPDTALFRNGARIEAKGGTESGDGGFIEVSGKKHVEVFGTADASAANGVGGLFFIDPYNITVQAAAGTLDGLTPNFVASAADSTVGEVAIETQLNSGTSVLIRTADGAEPTQTGLITQNVHIDKSAGGNATITYDAAGDIVLNSGISSTAGQLNVVMQANSATGGTPTGAGSVDIGAAITTNGGNFTSSGVNFDNTGGTITTAGGNVTLNHTGAVTVAANGGIATAGGNVNINASAARIVTTAPSDLIADITTAGGDITLESAGGITDSTGSGALDIDSGGGAVTLTGDGPGNMLVDYESADADAVNLTISHSGAGNVVYDSRSTDLLTIDASSLSDGNLEIHNDAGINVSGVIDTSGGSNDDLTIEASAGDVTLGNTDNLLTAGSGTVTLTAAAGDIVVANDTNVEVNTSGSVSITAQTIGASTGNQQLHLSGPSALSVTQTGPGSVDIKITGGDVVNIDDNIAGAILNDVSLTDRPFSYTATSGNILVDSVDVGTAGAAITASAGAIDETTSEDNAADITAGTLTLNAATGIGATRALELEVASLSAATTGAGANITLDQIGGGPLTLTSVTTADGTIDISADSGNIIATLVTAGGNGDILLDTTTSGDITLGSLTAAGDKITINSAGAIDDAAADAIADLTASELDLDAVDGIGAIAAIEAVATTIDADTTGDAAHIDIDNATASATQLTSISTTGAGANITVDQTGGGALTLTNVTTTDGTIDISADSGNIIATLVTAGDNGDILLDTTTSGGITLGSLTAVGDKITINSAGAIDDAAADTVADLTASELDLDAVDGIGAIAAIETVATTIDADTTGNAAHIDIDNASASATQLTSVSTTGAGANITLDQIGGGPLTLTSVTTTDGTINISADSGNIIATLVTAGANGDILLDTTTSGDITLGSLTAAGDKITINSAGAIDDAAADTIADLTASELDLDAVDGIGAIAAIETVATTIDADTTGNAAHIDIDNASASATQLTSVSTTGAGANITFDQTGGGPLTLTSVTTTDGTIDISADSGNIIATLVTAGANGDILLDTTTSGDITLGSLTAGNAISLEAAAGTITQGLLGLITANGGSLTLKSEGDLNAVNYTVANRAGTDLTLDSTGGSAIVTNSAADNWKSITAAAQHNVVLSGDGDITTGNLESRDGSGLNGVQIFTDTGSGGSLNAQGTILSGGFVTVDVEGQAGFAQPVSAGGNIDLETGSDLIANAMSSTGGNIEMTSNSGNLEINGNLTANSGGVSLIAPAGKIYTSGGANDTLNVEITGHADATKGVPLPYGAGTAGIVISSKENLIVGEGAVLTANGTYSLAVDDRSGVGFDTSPSEGGDPIDVAIYLGSYRPTPTPMGGDVTVGSRVSMADNGTMVVDAYDTVTLGGKFNKSVFNQITRLEVVSRISTTLNEVITYGRLPYADDPEAIRSWFTSPGSFTGAYVLRGVRVLFAEILALTNPVPLAPPKPLEPEVSGEVEGPDTEALVKLLNELGIGVQPYVTEAYAASLSTDLRLYSAAEKLQQLIPVLEDADGTHVAGLKAATAQFFPTLDVLSEEQMDSFAQELVRHKGDATNFDRAGQCIFALTEYVNILANDIGWPVEKSVGFVMSRYVPRLAEGDEIRIAVIQMQLQKASGV